jgi:hypothetical protein
MSIIESPTALEPGECLIGNNAGKGKRMGAHVIRTGKVLAVADRGNEVFAPCTRA